MMARAGDGLHRRGRYWHFKTKGANGRWSEQSTGTTHYQKAVAVRAAFVREREQGRLPNDRSKWSLAQAVSSWLPERRLRVARGTYLSDCTTARNLLRVFSPDAKLETLADIHLIHHYESTRLEEGISPKTVNNEILDLAAILRSASLWHRVADEYKPLKVHKSDVGRTLTREQAYSLLQLAQVASEDAVAPYAAVLSYATGMRQKEIRELQLGAIYLDALQPHIQVRRSTTKTDKGARYVALDTMACFALRRLLARARLLGATMPNHYLLPTLLEKHTRKFDPLHGGSGYDVAHPQSSWGTEWSRLRVQAKIEEFRFHDLRHSYITRAAEAGVPLPVIQAQVGHMSVQMVEHYTHICQPAIHRAAAQIESQSADLLEKLGLRATFDSEKCQLQQ